MATVRGGKDYSQVLAVGSEGPVASLTETTILSFTDIVRRRITKISCSGDVVSMWNFYIDSVLFDIKRGPDRNVELNFDWPLMLDETLTLDVKVTHAKISETPTFNVTVYGY